MTLRRLTAILAAVLALTVPQQLSAQQVTSLENLPLRSTLVEMLRPVAAGPVADAVALATAIEIATTPLGTSSGGFVFKLDPVTGLQVRSATTFGPSFSERALTAGEGKVSVAANLTVATYDKLNDLDLAGMQLSRVEAPSDFVSRTGNASLVLSSETLVMSGAIGATDNLDIGAAVPMVKVKLDGIAWVMTDSDVVAARATGAGIASGLGDVAVSAKYRFLKFGEDQPDPGGLAFMLVTRLPTGSRENFRGLGIVRSLGSVLFSSGTGKFRPHANGGFEWWEKGITVSNEIGSVELRHQIQYAAGLEFEAAPKLTLNVDVLGRHIRGGGEIENRSFPIVPDNPETAGATGLEAVTVSDHGIRKITLVPGLKWNMRGTFVFSFNALVPLIDNSLYDKFTPVIGLDWTF